MATIVPAILPTSRLDLEQKLGRLKGLASEVQVDIVDGVFASPASWPYAEGSTEFAHAAVLPHLEDFKMEVDLMVADPEQVTGAWIEAGATRILAHVESTTYLPKLITDLRVKYGHEKAFSSILSFGLAINVATDLALLAPYIEEADYVQFMGIKDIGKQGQPFSTEVLNKIAVFRKRYPDMPIQVDGGVNFESAPVLLGAGVDRLVVGSALWKAPNLEEAYFKLSGLSELHGIYE